MDATPKRPWWCRRRWFVLAAFWLLAAYPFVRGPAEYVAVRGWIARPAVDAAYGALDLALPASGPPRPTPVILTKRIYTRDPHPLGRHYRRYVDWWRNLAYHHEGVFVTYVPILR